MQKSKKSTILIILLIFIYGLISTSKLVIDINIPYLYIINPMFWLGMALILKILIPPIYEKRKLKKEIISYVIIAGFSYIIIYIISGILIGFGKNPFSTTIIGYIANIWITMTIIISKEYIRYKLINNVYDREKNYIAFIISIVYIIIDFGLYKFISAEQITILMIEKQLIQVIIPSICKNVLYSYIAINSSYIPAIIYEFIINTYLWMAPILPNSPWIITVIIESIIPIVVLLYIRYIKLQKDLFKSREMLRVSDPGSIIPLIVVVILLTWFALGIFPIVPVAIASESMKPEFTIGDVILIKKCNIKDVIVGDIIQYKLENYTVVHRVIEKKENNGKVILTTKGDNNNTPDVKTVTEEQLIGKNILKIKYIGYPAIWLHLIEEQKMDIQVETGK